MPMPTTPTSAAARQTVLPPRRVLHFLGPPGTYSHQVALGLIARDGGGARARESHDAVSAEDESPTIASPSPLPSPLSPSSSASSSTRLIACPTITSTLLQCTKGIVDEYDDGDGEEDGADEVALEALLPFENSTFGRVRETCDLLGIKVGDADDRGRVREGNEFDVHFDDKSSSSPSPLPLRIRIVLLVVHSIEHSLLVSKAMWQRLTHGTQEVAPGNVPLESLREIELVQSHEQALGQCSQFLKSYLPNATQRKTSSTAGAAESLDPSSPHAAIASSICATHRIYPGLHLARKNIQDRSDNRTTFLLVRVVEQKRPA